MISICVISIQAVKGEKGYSEAMIVPVHSPNRSQSRPSTSATSSNFQASSSSYEHSPSATGVCLRPASLCPSSCLYVSPRACCMCHHPHCHLTPGSPTSALDHVTHVLTLTVTWSPIHPPLHMTLSPVYSPSLSCDPKFTHICTWPCYSLSLSYDPRFTHLYT